MTAIQIIILIVFFVLFLALTIKISNKINEAYVIAQFVCFMFIYIMLFASIILTNRLQSKPPCPQEKVEINK